MKNKPIYLFVTPFFPTPESWRGAFCYDFVKALIKTDRYDVRVLVPGGKGSGDYEYHGIKVTRFRNYQPFRGGFLRFLAYPFSRRALERKVLSMGITPADVAVYHAHDVSLVPFVHGLKNRNPNIEVVLHCHNAGHPFTLECGRFGVIPLYSTVYYLYLRWCFEQVDLPVFVSDRQRRHFGKWYRDGFTKPPVKVLDGVWFGRWLRPITLRNIHVLYNGIDYESFNDEGRPVHDGFVIGCVANFSFIKDQMTLIKAIDLIHDKIPGLKVKLVGSGIMQSACCKFVVEHGHEEMVEFIKEMDHLKLPDFYRSLDLFVLPSWAEGFACSYMEAYGCGTPFMGCWDVSVEEALPEADWDKWLFKRQDYEALAKLILDYVKNHYPQRLSRDFNIDTLVGEFLNTL